MDRMSSSLRTLCVSSDLKEISHCTIHTFQSCLLSHQPQSATFSPFFSLGGVITMYVGRDVQWCMTTYSLSPWFCFFFSLSVCLSVAIMLKDDYFVRGAGLPGRFKAEKVEFHWGPSNGSEGSEHSINGRRYPVEVRTVDQVFKHHEVSVIWEKVIKFLKRCRLWCGWGGSLDVYRLFLQGKKNIYLSCWPCVSRRDTHFL